MLYLFYLIYARHLGNNNLAYADGDMVLGGGAWEVLRRYESLLGEGHFADISGLLATLDGILLNLLLTSLLRPALPKESHHPRLDLVWHFPDEL